MDYRSCGMWGRAACLLALASVACTGSTIDVETDSAESGSEPTTDATSTTMGDTTSSTVDPDSSGGPAPTEREVDILFVIDNSGSMGEEQAAIAASIGTLVGALDAVDPPVDYRVGVTTTDNGNPWCQGTTPEAGGLRSTSCRERPGEFVFEGAQTIDATQEACFDVCTLDTLALAGGDPWLEVDGSTGTANVPLDQVEETLRCMLPQGINGCGFEQPLESLWKAVSRFETDADPSFGFARPGALLAAIVITDEADCSYNNDWETIFLPDGDRVFWSDPTAPAPTSAVCWNAGVACTGSGVYDNCASVNLDVNGNEVGADPDANAVLRPIDRYIDQLAGEYGAYVIAINGVGVDGTVTYADSLQDPDFQGDFGIGPGCSSSAGLAVPPVRLREVIEAVSGGGNLYSICSPDYSDAFEAFVNGILARLP